MLNESRRGSVTSNGPYQPATVEQHIYRTGFKNAQFTDVCLTISFPPDTNTISLQYQLHKLILSQSIFFHACFLNAPNIQELSIQIPLPSITHQSIADVLGYLYSPSSLAQPTDDTILPLLQTSIHFGVPALTAQITNQILTQHHINLATIHAYTRYIPFDCNVPELQYLKGVLFEYLTKGVYEDIMGGAGDGREFVKERIGGERYDVGVRVFAGLSFEWCKAVVESKRSLLDEGIFRYKFAKSIITYRQQQLGHVDETVLATFGGEAGSRRVNIVRKTRKGTSNGNSGLVRSFSPDDLEKKEGDGRRVWKFHDDY